MNANKYVLTAPTRRIDCMTLHQRAGTTYRFYSWRRPPEKSVPIIGHDTIYDHDFMITYFANTILIGN